MSAPHTAQPGPTPALPDTRARGGGLRARAAFVREKVTTRDGWLGDYDYAWLCTPTLPWGRRGKRSTAPPFYALEQELPLLLAITTGLQHSLAMLAGESCLTTSYAGRRGLNRRVGLITPPIIFASALNLDASTSAYMISASLIGCGTSLCIGLWRTRD